MTGLTALSCRVVPHNATTKGGMQDAAWLSGPNHGDVAFSSAVACGCSVDTQGPRGLNAISYLSAITV
jgi:hypothetical protein